MSCLCVREVSWCHVFVLGKCPGVMSLCYQCSVYNINFKEKKTILKCKSVMIITIIFLFTNI